MGFFRGKQTIRVKDINFSDKEGFAFSEGLRPYIHKELKIRVPEAGLNAMIPVLTYLVEFITDEGLQLSDGERMSCFAWSLMVVDEGSHFHVLEVFPQKNGFIEGIEQTLEQYHEQMEVCQLIGTDPAFPIFDQRVTISHNVRNGYQAHLFRWNKEDPDSGWVAMTDNYDDQQTAFEQMTVGQLITLRPEFTKFFALPPGYKVIWEGNDAKIAFDPNMAVPK